MQIKNEKSYKQIHFCNVNITRVQFVYWLWLQILKPYWKDVLSVKPQVWEKHGSHLLDSCLLVFGGWTRLSPEEPSNPNYSVILFLVLVNSLLKGTKGKHWNKLVWSHIPSKKATFMAPSLCNGCISDPLSEHTGNHTLKLAFFHSICIRIHIEKLSNYLVLFEKLDLFYKINWKVLSHPVTYQLNGLYVSSSSI